MDGGPLPVNAVFNSLMVIGSWTELQSIPINNLLEDGLVIPLGYAVWVMVFWVRFGLKHTSTMVERRVWHQPIDEAAVADAATEELQGRLL